MWRTFVYYDESGNKINHLRKEKEEQILAEQYVLPTDCVLELGARYGTVSCITNHILLDKTKHVVVEPDDRVWSALEENKKRNKGEFYILKGFCSRQPLTLYDKKCADGYGAKSKIDAKSSMLCQTVEELETLIGRKFNVLIADCEGFLEQFLQENPVLLKQLRCIIFEKDNQRQCDYSAIKKNLFTLGFKQKVCSVREVWIQETLSSG